ncbi:PAI1 [Auxenochlorella protothecoides x Auxenochlorella symbiontica]
MRIHAPFTSAPASHAHKWGSCSRPWCVRPGGTGTAVAPPTRVSALPTAPLIKVCGVTRPEDAAHAAAEGANLVGMIMWPRAPRALTVEAAQAVAAAARSHGAEPVGVFVDEDAETIARVAQLGNFSTVQLHGAASQRGLAHIPLHLQVVFVVTVDADGKLQTEIPDPLPRPIDLFLVDSAKRKGPSIVLDWRTLPPPRLASARWLLAGGLTAETVKDAIMTANPCGVDVSSGVCGPDGLAKDHAKVAGFVKAAAQGFSSITPPAVGV